jgi:hypothetical protein
VARPAVVALRARAEQRMPGWREFTAKKGAGSQLNIQEAQAQIIQWLPAHTTIVKLSRQSTGVSKEKASSTPSEIIITPNHTFIDPESHHIQIIYLIRRRYVFPPDPNMEASTFA